MLCTTTLHTEREDYGPDCAAQGPYLSPSHGPSIHGPSGPVTGTISHLMDHPQSHNAAPNSEASCPRSTSSGGRHRRGPWAVVDLGPWVVAMELWLLLGQGRTDVWSAPKLDPKL